MLPIAHAGHWAIWVLYAVPVIVVLGSIVAQIRRQRRQDEPAGERSEAHNSIPGGRTGGADGQSTGGDR